MAAGGAVRAAIEEAAAEVEATLATLVPEWMSPRDAGSLVERLSRLANVVELARARCARRAADGLVHLVEGYRSPAAWLADKAGASVGEAMRALSGAEAAESLPALGEAVSSGEVSLDKAAIVAAAAGEDTTAGEELAEAARHESLKGLKARVEARRAARESERQLEARHEALHERRYLRTWTAVDGACRGEFSLAPMDAAPLLARLEAERERRFDEARRNGEREAYEAYNADALCALAAAGVPSARAGTVLAAGDSAVAGDESVASCDAVAPRCDKAGISATGMDHGGGARLDGRPRARVLLRVDLPALLRGERQGDEICEVAGVGTVPLAHAKALLGDAVVDLVIRKGVEVVSVTSLGRTIPRAVRVALMDRDTTCVVPGCGAHQRLEIDHWRVDFARGGPTQLDNLALLCQFHHRMKTHRGWRLEGGPGRWRWVGPHEDGARTEAPPGR